MVPAWGPRSIEPHTDIIIYIPESDSLQQTSRWLIRVAWIVDISRTLDRNMVLTTEMEDYPMFMKGLQFTTVEQSRDPLLSKRTKLVNQLLEQKALVADANHVRRRVQFTGKGAERRQVEKVQRIRPWFRESADGTAVMTVVVSGRPLLFTPDGKAGIATTREKLPGLIDGLVSAVRAGELDSHLSAKFDAPRKPKARKS
jgi:hypothetical protein